MIIGKKVLLTQAILHKTFGYLNLDGYKPGTVHALLRTEPWSSRDLNRISAKLKLLCGAYTLQSNRPACNQPGVKPICQLCCSDEETLEHFVLYCSALEYTRNSVISDISHEVDSLLNKPYFSDLTDDEKLQIILDCTVLVDQQNRKLQIEQFSSLEFHSKRLLHSLLGVRYRMLKTIPKTSISNLILSRS